MKRLSFPDNVYKVTDEGILFEKTEKIIYRCECGYDCLWVDTWDDETKAKVQAEIDAHAEQNLRFRTSLRKGSENVVF
jgi:hypothetical protein